MIYQTSTKMRNFRDTMRLMNALYLTFNNNMATLWPVVQQQAVQQVAVEVQRQVVVETQNQVSAFCLQMMLHFLYNWMYNHPVVATVLTVITTIVTVIEYSTGVVSEGAEFGYEFCVWAKYFMCVIREINDWFGPTPKDWVCIAIGTFLCYKIFPFIFRIMDWFHSESDKPETSETREPRKKVDARVRGARGKSPGAKKEE